jgi:glycosyltransferase involved in cell wall biosynthesis
VLVDDASGDDAVEVFERFAKQYENIKMVRVANNEQFWGNKKYALTLGIKAASNNCLLFIDNNCLPTTRNWISTMSSCFNTEKSIVLGYNSVVKQIGFLNTLIRFDNFFKNLQLFAWAKNGSPFSGSNKNIAYTKEIFFGVKGFVNHIKFKHGETALFVNEAATCVNTEVSVYKEAFSTENVNQNFKQWMVEKKKESLIIKYFKTKDKLRLFFFSIIQIMFFVVATVLLITKIEPLLVMGLIAFRYIFVGISFSKAANKLNEKGLVFFFPLFEVMLSFIHLSHVNNLIFTKNKN